MDPDNIARLSDGIRRRKRGLNEQMEGTKNRVHVIFKTNRIFPFATNIHKIKLFH